VFSFESKQVTDVPSSAQFDRAALARQIQALVTRLHPKVTLERRRAERFSIPVSFRLTPLAEDGQPIASEAINVIGKNISRYGLSFYHAAPLACRRAKISVENMDVVFTAEIEINWCRFSKPGWYESGSRFTAAMPPESTRQNHRRENSDERINKPASNRRTA
jgi:hypothetical protein